MSIPIYYLIYWYNEEITIHCLGSLGYLDTCFPPNPLCNGQEQRILSSYIISNPIQGIELAAPLQDSLFE